MITNNYKYVKTRYHVCKSDGFKGANQPCCGLGSCRQVRDITFLPIIFIYNDKSEPRRLWLRQRLDYGVLQTLDTNVAVVGIAAVTTNIGNLFSPCI